MTGPGPGTVLVVDDDVDVASFLAITLRQEGYEVRLTETGQDALDLIDDQPPDLVLLDLGMRDLDGIQLCRELRAATSSAPVPVIVLGEHDGTPDRVLAFDAGADDFVPLPFEPLELVARVRSTLRRNSELRAVSPLTGLPGNNSIDQEIVRRHRSDEPYAVCHVDLDQFKAFNDAYGFLRGDGVIRLLARCLREACASVTGPPAFTGHVGGDDFVVVCAPEQAEPVAATVLRLFDSAAPLLHDPVDVERGAFTVVDRKGNQRVVPLVTVSIGVALSNRRTSPDHRQVAAYAAEMKQVAKASPGSQLAVDRRAD